MGLLKKRFESEKINAVYSSDLTRTRVTATALSEPRGLDITTTEMLREVCVGEWEDISWGDIGSIYPEMSANFGHDPAKWRVGGSEPYEDVIKRMMDFIKDTARRHDGEVIAFFSHGFAIRAFFCCLLGISSEEVWKIKYCDNTAVALLNYDNGELTVEYQGDNSHLSQETSTFARQKWWRAEKNMATENLRYVPLDKVRDSAIINSYHLEAGKRAAADKEYAAFLEDEPVGLLGLDTEKGSNEGCGWISSIYIDPDYRDMRFGVQLIGHAISEYRRMRRETLWIEAPRDSIVFHLCKNYGFEVVSDKGDRLLMEKYIRNWQ